MYNPYDWYWLKQDGTVYSSARQRTYAQSNTDYKTWLGVNSMPTPYPKDASGNESDAEMSDVLSPYGIRFSPESAADAKTRIKSQVDTDAETERLKYITPGVGQAMTYTQKADEATRYLVSSVIDPKPADYPLLNAEVGITAADIPGVAAVVNAAFQQWQLIGAAIEATRLGTKAAIDAAVDVGAAQTLYDAIEWPHP